MSANWSLVPVQEQPQSNYPAALRINATVEHLVLPSAHIRLTARRKQMSLGPTDVDERQGARPGNRDGRLSLPMA
ncbi:MAG TPA: hypothetical protein VGJ14_02830, partial [Sporichthyaceae bacterium]